METVITTGGARVWPTSDALNRKRRKGQRPARTDQARRSGESGRESPKRDWMLRKLGAVSVEFARTR